MFLRLKRRYILKYRLLVFGEALTRFCKISYKAFFSNCSSIHKLIPQAEKVILSMYSNHPQIQEQQKQLQEQLQKRAEEARKKLEGAQTAPPR